MLQVSVIQIMIDNCVDIFGEDEHTMCDNSKKRSDDKKTSVNTAGKYLLWKKTMDGHSEKTSIANTDKLKISSASSQAEVPTGLGNLISHQMDGRIIFPDFINLQISEHYCGILWY